jgi:hypothetical protein
MLNPRVLLAMSCVGALAACTSTEHVEPDLSHADIANVKTVRSDIPATFHVTDIAPAGIDPHLLEAQPLPGVKFDPADCAGFATKQVLPEGVKGNMSAIVAEGDGNRFVVIAVETSETVPENEPPSNCQKVSFDGPGLRGLVEVVDAPKIDSVHTLGAHRVIQTTVDGKTRTGELYNYVARFGSFLVIVTANPLVVPDKPVVPVDTNRAGDLLTAGVAAVKA